MKLRGIMSAVFDNSASAVGFSMIIYLFLSYTLSAVASFFTDRITEPAYSLTVLSIEAIVYITVFTVTVFLMSISRVIVFTKPVPNQIAIILPVFFSCFLLSANINYFFAPFFSRLGIHGPPDLHYMPHSSLGILLYVILNTLVPAFCEELLFRKVMLQRLAEYGNGTAVVISSVIFALLHYDIPHLPTIFLIGIVFSYTTLKLRSIFPSMLMHFLYNFFAVLLSDFDDMLTQDLLQVIFNIIVLAGIISSLLLTLYAGSLMAQGRFREASGIKKESSDTETLPASSLLKNPYIIIFTAAAVLLTVSLEFLPRLMQRS